MQDNRQKTTILLALIGLAAIVAYIPALRAGFIWDDDAYVELNETLTSAGGLFDIWFQHTPEIAIPQWYPLVHTTFWIEFHLWGLEPFGYHLVNLILHLTSAWMLFTVVRRLGLPGAILIAGVFALHPVMVESVAWITERKNVLSMVFYLGAMKVYLRYAGLADADPGHGGRGKLWWIAFGLFACALTSKSVTFSLPFTILLITWWKRGRLEKADIVALLPFIVLGVAYGIYTSHLEDVKVGAHGPEWDQTLLERCLIAGRVPWFYFSKLIWPAELTFIYERWVVDVGEAWQFAFPAAVLLLVGALVFIAWKKGVRAPLAAVLMFGGTLFPAIGFVDVYPFRYSFVADHFQYHASLGIIVLVCAWLAARVPARIGMVATVIVLGLYGARTWSQTHKYENKEVLYNSILDDNPDGWFAHNNLAAIYVVREEWQRGFDSYRKTKRLHPLLALEATPEAYAHCMVADMIAKTWSLWPAMQIVGKAPPPEVVRLRDMVMPYVTMAKEHFEKSIGLSPKYHTPRLDLGTLMQGLAHVTLEKDPRPIYGIAVRSWGTLLEMKPEDSNLRAKLHNLHMYLANMNEQMGHKKIAEAHRATALGLRMADPNPRGR